MTLGTKVSLQASPLEYTLVTTCPHLLCIWKCKMNFWRSVICACDFTLKFLRPNILQRVLLKCGTEWKTEWNGKRHESFEGKQNMRILLIQLLTKENDLKQNKTLIFNQILANKTLIINISTWLLSQSFSFQRIH